MTNTKSRAATFTREDWQRGYRSLEREESYWIEGVEGTLPVDLRGTLFRNGPGLLDRNGELYGHPFDGDGLICRISFAGERAHFACSFVKTPEFLAEAAAGKILYRGVFGTQKKGGWLANAFDFRLKNIANTNVVYQGGKLLALWEADRPYRLAPDTLSTLGLEDFDGRLGPKQAFTAHPRRDPATGDLWAFGVEAGPKSRIHGYRVDPSGQLHRVFQQEVNGFCFLHDFAWTPHTCLFVQNPVQFQPLPFLLGMRTAGECLSSVDNAPSQLLAIERTGRMRTLPLAAGFIFHHGNAYEDGSPDRLVLDSVCYREYPKLEPGTDFRQVDFDKVVSGEYCRFRVNWVTGEAEREVLFPHSCEFPTVHPRCVGQPYRYVYLGIAENPEGKAPLQGIAKLDVETKQAQTYSFAPRGFVGEPVFVPRPGGTAEDDGWVLVMVFNAARDRSEVVVLAAQDLRPVAMLPLKHHVPYGLHGCFVPELWV